MSETHVSGPAAGEKRPAPHSGPAPGGERAAQSGTKKSAAPLHVLYEDDALIVCEKPAGVLSEEAAATDKAARADTMPALLRAYRNNPRAYIGVVHRLDAGVSGLMVFARTPEAAAALSRQLQAAGEGADRTGKSFEKEYRAVIAGGADETLAASGTLRDYLFKDSRRGRVFTVERPRKGVKEAVLDYEILATVTLPAASPCAALPAESAAADTRAEAPKQFSIVRIVLRTGRTHQIRAQFASRRHPLFGDGKYGSREKGAIALQSARLRFYHPVTGRAMEFTLSAPPTLPWALFSQT